MNKKQGKEIMEFLNSNDFIQTVYTKQLIELSLLDPGKKLIFRGDDNTPILEFINKNLDVINIEKFALFGVYMFDTYCKETKDIYVKEIIKKIHNQYLALAKKYISKDSDVVLFDVESNPKKRFNIVAISPSNYIYGKRFNVQKLKLEKYFPDMVRIIDIDFLDELFKEDERNTNIPEVIKSTVLGNVVYDLTGERKEINRLAEIDKNITDRVDFNTRMRNELLKYLSIPEIKEGLNEDKLYIFAAYEYLYNLEVITKFNIQDNDKKCLIDINFLKKIKEMLDAVQDYTDTKDIKMLIYTKNQNDQQEVATFSKDLFKKDCKEIFDNYITSIIVTNESKYFDMDYVSLLSKDAALALANNLDLNKKCKYYYTLYKAKCISYKEMIEFEKNNNADTRIYVLRALIDKINQKNKSINIEYDENSNDFNTYFSKINSPEILFSISLSDKSIYDLLDTDLKKYYLEASMNQYLSNGRYKSNALSNLTTLLKNGDISDDFIKEKIIENNDIEKIESLFGRDKIKELFNISKLVSNFIEINDGNKDALKEYELQRKLYNYYDYINDSKMENNLLNELELLAFEPEVLEKLYVDGLISIKTVSEFDKNIVTEIYEKDLIRSEDKKYCVQSLDIENKVGDLIKLNQDGILSNKEVFDLYMSGKITLNDIKGYSEGIDISNIFNESEFVNYTKRFAMIKKKEIRDQFIKYSKAYLQIVGVGDKESDTVISSDLQAKLFKALGENNAREEDIIELYKMGLLEFKNLDANYIKDSLLIKLIKEGSLKSEDEEYLFRDTKETGTKYRRLENILPELNNSQRINLLASVYKTKEGETDQIAEMRSNELLKYLDDAISEKDEKINNRKSKTNKNSEGNAINSIYYGNNNTTRARISTLGNLFSLFKEIKPNYEHMIASGTYIVNLGDNVVVEEVYKTSSNSIENKSGEHALYILSEKIKEQLTAKSDISLYEAVLKNLLETNRIGENYFNWSFITEMKRMHVDGINKCLHTDNFVKNLKKKIGMKDTVDENKRRNCLKNITPAGQSEDLSVDEEEHEI